MSVVYVCVCLCVSVGGCYLENSLKKSTVSNNRSGERLNNKLLVQVAIQLVSLFSVSAHGRVPLCNGLKL